MMIKTMKLVTAVTVAFAAGTALAVGTCMVYRAATKPKYTEPPINPEPKENSS